MITGSETGGRCAKYKLSSERVQREQFIHLFLQVKLGKKMGSKKERGTQLSQILLCVLVVVFASCAIVFVALYFIKYGEDNGKDHVWQRCF